MLSVAANGSVVGSGGGSWRVGYWQFCVSLSESAAIIFSLHVPTEGKESGMIPSATQASLLRNSLLELSVTYVICLVSTGSPWLSSPDMRRIVAPRIVIPPLYAACIFIVTGMRSDFVQVYG